MPTVLVTGNQSEWRLYAWEQTGVSTHEAVPVEEIQSAMGGEPAAPNELDPVRRKIEDTIKANWERIRTQLPSCQGDCTTRRCPGVIVFRCRNYLRQYMT